MFLKSVLSLYLNRNITKMFLEHVSIMSAGEHPYAKISDFEMHTCNGFYPGIINVLSAYLCDRVYVSFVSF